MSSRSLGPVRLSWGKHTEPFLSEHLARITPSGVDRGRLRFDPDQLLNKNKSLDTLLPCVTVYSLWKRRPRPHPLVSRADLHERLFAGPDAQCLFA